MEYGRREPMKSESAKEPTAFTMKSIKELLEEEAAFGEAVTMRTPLPKSQLQQPPHLRGEAPEPVVQAAVKATKPALKASSAPKIDAEMTARPMAIPASVREAALASAPQPVAEHTQAKSRSFLGRLIGS